MLPSYESQDLPEAKNSKPQVSVVVPIYNGERDLPDLIACLRQQTYPSEKVEYLLVDNNSSDRTASLLEAATRDIPEIAIRPLSENKIQSSYAARNAGIRAAKGEIIAFTDADCRPRPEWLASLIKPFTNPDVGLVAGEIAALAGNSLLERYADRKDVLSQKHTLAHTFCPYGQTANLAVRREILTEVGLFRPYLTTGGDADFCWRILRSTDWQLEFAANAVVEHRHRSTLRQLAGQWRRYGESNRYLHELHGVELMRSPTTYEYFYRLSRWLLKELPVTSAKAIVGKSDLVDILGTPIDLVCLQARTQGQKESLLPRKARDIQEFKE